MTINTGKFIHVTVTYTPPGEDPLSTTIMTSKVPSFMQPTLLRAAPSSMTLSKWIIAGAVGLVLGSAGGFCLAIYASSSIVAPGDAVAREYEVHFGSIASRNGIPKSAEAALLDAQNLQALNTVLVGLHFAQIEDEQLRAEVVRITRLIDSNPDLRGQVTGQNAAWADETRECILKNESRPDEVVSCVRNAPSAMKVGEPTQAGRTASH